MSKVIPLIISGALAFAFYLLYTQSAEFSIPLGNTIPIMASSQPTMSITVPPFSVQPGQSQTQTLMIQWEGAAKIIISKIEFNSDEGLFYLRKSLPYAAVAGNRQGSIGIPLTVSMPIGEQALHEVVQMRVTVLMDGSPVEQVLPVMVNTAPLN